MMDGTCACSCMCVRLHAAPLSDDDGWTHHRSLRLPQLSWYGGTLSGPHSSWRSHTPRGPRNTVRDLYWEPPISAVRRTGLLLMRRGAA